MGNPAPHNLGGPPLPRVAMQPSRIIAVTTVSLALAVVGLAGVALRQRQQMGMMTPVKETVTVTVTPTTTSPPTTIIVQCPPPPETPPRIWTIEPTPDPVWPTWIPQPRGEK